MSGTGVRGLPNTAEAVSGAQVRISQPVPAIPVFTYEVRTLDPPPAGVILADGASTPGKYGTVLPVSRLINADSTLQGRYPDDTLTPLFICMTDADLLLFSSVLGRMTWEELLPVSDSTTTLTLFAPSNDALNAALTGATGATATPSYLDRLWRLPGRDGARHTALASAPTFVDTSTDFAATGQAGTVLNTLLGADPVTRDGGQEVKLSTTSSDDLVVYSGADPTGAMRPTDARLKRLGTSVLEPGKLVVYKVDNYIVTASSLGAPVQTLEAKLSTMLTEPLAQVGVSYSLLSGLGAGSPVNRLLFSATSDVGCDVYVPTDEAWGQLPSAALARLKSAEGSALLERVFLAHCLQRQSSPLSVAARSSLEAGWFGNATAWARAARTEDSFLVAVSRALSASSPLGVAVSAPFGAAADQGEDKAALFGGPATVTPLADDRDLWTTTARFSLIDRVLVPESVANLLPTGASNVFDDVIAVSSEHTTLASLIRLCGGGLLSALREPPAVKGRATRALFTVFAPTDAALAAALASGPAVPVLLLGDAAATAPVCTDRLDRLLRAHVAIRLDPTYARLAASGTAGLDAATTRTLLPGIDLVVRRTPALTAATVYDLSLNDCVAAGGCTSQVTTTPGNEPILAGNGGVYSLSGILDLQEVLSLNDLSRATPSQLLASRALSTNSLLQRCDLISAAIASALATDPSYGVRLDSNLSTVMLPSDITLRRTGADFLDAIGARPLPPASSPYNNTFRAANLQRFMAAYTIPGRYALSGLVAAVVEGAASPLTTADGFELPLGDFLPGLGSGSGVYGIAVGGTPGELASVLTAFPSPPTGTATFAFTDMLRIPQSVAYNRSGTASGLFPSLNTPASLFSTVASRLPAALGIRALLGLASPVGNCTAQVPVGLLPETCSGGPNSALPVSLTLLAPTDAAFARTIAAFPAFLAWLLNPMPRTTDGAVVPASISFSDVPTRLNFVVATHVLSPAVSSSSFNAVGVSTRSLAGIDQTVTLVRNASGFLLAEAQGTVQSGVTARAVIDPARVDLPTSAPFPGASAGRDYAHVLDDLLLAPGLPALPALTLADRLSTLPGITIARQLIAALPPDGISVKALFNATSNSGGMTVLLPSDASLSTVDPFVVQWLQRPENSRVLDELIASHIIVEGNYLEAAAFQYNFNDSAGFVPTAYGRDIPISRVPGGRSDIQTYSINGNQASVTFDFSASATAGAYDAVATTGVIHVIDGMIVLNPDDLAAANATNVYDDLVAADSRFLALRSLMALSPSLVQRIRTAPAVTLLAPTNNGLLATAGAIGFPALLQFLQAPSNRPLLEQILGQHIVFGRRLEVTTLAPGAVVDAQSSSGARLSLSRPSTGGNAQASLGTSAPVFVTDPDLAFDNGLVQVVDGLLVGSAVAIPELSLGQLLRAQGGFDTMAALLAASDSATRDLFDGGGVFSVFVPTDGAFAKLPSAVMAALLAQPARTVGSVLRGHMLVEGKFVFSADIPALSDTAEPTMLGSTVANGALRLSAGTPTSGEVPSYLGLNGYGLLSGSGLGGSIVTPFDLSATNGVIHAVDTVLLPQAIAAAAFANLQPSTMATQFFSSAPGAAASREWTSLRALLSRDAQAAALLSPTAASPAYRGPYTMAAPLNSAAVGLGNLSGIVGFLDATGTIAEFVARHLIVGTDVVVGDVAAGTSTTYNTAAAGVTAAVSRDGSSSAPRYGGVAFATATFPAYIDQTVATNTDSQQGRVSALDGFAPGPWCVPPAAAGGSAVTASPAGCMPLPKFSSIADLAANTVRDTQNAFTFTIVSQLLAMPDVAPLVASISSKPATVFLPSDDAIRAQLEDFQIAFLLRPDQAQARAELLSYHVVPGAALTTTDLQAMIERAALASDGAIAPTLTTALGAAAPRLRLSRQVVRVGASTYNTTVLSSGAGVLLTPHAQATNQWSRLKQPPSAAFSADAILQALATNTLVDVATVGAVAHCIDGLLLPPSLALPDEPFASNVYDNVLQATPSLSIAAALFNSTLAVQQRLREKTDERNTNAPFTVFAPTNTYLAALLAGFPAFERFSQARQGRNLQELVEAHVVTGAAVRLDTSFGGHQAAAGLAAAADTQPLTTLYAGEAVVISNTSASAFLVTPLGADGSPASSLAVPVATSPRNLVADNGVVHGVDGLVLSATRGIPTLSIVDTLDAAGQFSTLLSLLRGGTADLLPQFRYLDNASVVFFAPTDAALAKLSDAQREYLSENPASFEAILRGHVLPDAYLYPEDLDGVFSTLSSLVALCAAQETTGLAGPQLVVRVLAPGASSCGSLATPGTPNTAAFVMQLTPRGAISGGDYLETTTGMAYAVDALLSVDAGLAAQAAPAPIPDGVDAATADPVQGSRRGMAMRQLMAFEPAVTQSIAAKAFGPLTLFRPGDGALGDDLLAAETGGLWGLRSLLLNTPRGQETTGTAALLWYSTLPGVAITTTTTIAQTYASGLVGDPPIAAPSASLYAIDIDAAAGGTVRVRYDRASQDGAFAGSSNIANSGITDFPLADAGPSALLASETFSLRPRPVADFASLISNSPDRNIGAGVTSSSSLARFNSLVAAAGPPTSIANALAGIVPLQGGGTTTGVSLTLLAPTNAAFDDVPPSRLAYLQDPANAASLEQVLQFHVLVGALLRPAQLPQGYAQRLPTLLASQPGVLVRRTADASQPSGFVVTAEDSVFLNQTSSKLTRNGAVVEVSALLVPAALERALPPQTNVIDDVVSVTPALAVIRRYLSLATGAESLLRQDAFPRASALKAPFTLILPTSFATIALAGTPAAAELLASRPAGFDSAAPSVFTPQPSGLSVLDSILLRHAIPGRSLTAQQLAALAPASFPSAANDGPCALDGQPPSSVLRASPRLSQAVCHRIVVSAPGSAGALARVSSDPLQPAAFAGTGDGSLTGANAGSADNGIVHLSSGGFFAPPNTSALPVASATAMLAAAANATSPAFLAVSAQSPATASLVGVTGVFAGILAAVAPADVIAAFNGLVPDGAGSPSTATLFAPSDAALLSQLTPNQTAFLLGGASPEARAAARQLLLQHVVVGSALYSGAAAARRRLSAAALPGPGFQATPILTGTAPNPFAAAGAATPFSPAALLSVTASNPAAGRSPPAPDRPYRPVEGRVLLSDREAAGTVVHVIDTVLIPPELTAAWPADPCNGPATGTGACSGQGICLTGACICDPGFAGPACELQATPAAAAALPACSNGIRDAGESDVDCGGPSCEPCGQAQACRTSSDCFADAVCSLRAVSSAQSERVCLTQAFATTAAYVQFSMVSLPVTSSQLRSRGLSLHLRQTVASAIGYTAPASAQAAVALLSVADSAASSTVVVRAYVPRTARGEEADAQADAKAAEAAAAISAAAPAIQADLLRLLPAIGTARPDAAAMSVPASSITTGRGDGTFPSTPAAPPPAPGGGAGGAIAAVLVVLVLGVAGLVVAHREGYINMGSRMAGVVGASGSGCFRKGGRHGTTKNRVGEVVEMKMIGGGDSGSRRSMVVEEMTGELSPQPEDLVEPLPLRASVVATVSGGPAHTARLQPHTGIGMVAASQPNIVVNPLQQGSSRM